jgi:hypothetical protein
MSLSATIFAKPDTTITCLISSTTPYGNVGDAFVVAHVKAREYLNLSAIAAVDSGFGAN